MTDRRAVLIVLGSSLLAVRRVAAQTPAKLPRVAVLSFGFASAQISAQGQAAFEAGRRELGWTPGSTITVVTPNVNRAARALGLEIQHVTVSTAEELPRAFSIISRRQSGGVVVHADGGGPLDREVTRLVSLAATHRLPAMYAWRQHVEAGGLMAFAVDIADIQRQTARFVDKILKGTKPADIPVEQPTKFELVINLSAARNLALTIPQSLLQRADHLIQ